MSSGLVGRMRSGGWSGGGGGRFGFFGGVSFGFYKCGDYGGEVQVGDHFGLE